MTSESAGEHAGNGTRNAIKKSWNVMHGAGDAIRGNFAAYVDSATGDREAMARDHEIAARGVDEIEKGRSRGTRVAEGRTQVSPNVAAPSGPGGVAEASPAAEIAPPSLPPRNLHQQQQQHPPDLYQPDLHQPGHPGQLAALSQQQSYGHQSQQQPFGAPAGQEHPYGTEMGYQGRK